MEARKLAALLWVRHSTFLNEVVKPWDGDFATVLKLIMHGIQSGKWKLIERSPMPYAYKWAETVEVSAYSRFVDGKFKNKWEYQDYLYRMEDRMGILLEHTWVIKD